MSAIDSRARDVILERLQSRAAEAKPLFRGEYDSDIAVSVPSAVTGADGSGLALAKTFGENLTEVLGTYEIVNDAGDLPGRIITQIGSWRKESDVPDSYGSEILSWAANELPIHDLSAQLEALGVSLFVPNEMHDEEERSHAATLPVGLTGVDAAFAGTGSMVVVSGPGKSRAASLLPLHHIALVPVSKIFSNLESWLAKLRSDGELEELFRENAQLAFITGPSKSADIELNLTLGVHGPRDVHVVIFDDGR